MCVIGLIPKGTPLMPKSFVDQGAKRNRDGSGFMVATPEGIKYYKQVEYTDEFYKVLKETHRRYGKTSSIVIHHRIATHGVVSKENTHPFAIGKDMGMAHNGTIHRVTGVITRFSERSDTRTFTEDVLGTLGVDWWGNEAMLDLIHNFVGFTNKIAFLHKDGKYLVLNRDKWTEHEGILYSNPGMIVKDTIVRETAPVKPAPERTWSPAIKKVDKKPVVDVAYTAVIDRVKISIPCCVCSTPVNRDYDEDGTEYCWNLDTSGQQCEGTWLDEKHPLCFDCFCTADGEKETDQEIYKRKTQCGVPSCASTYGPYFTDIYNGQKVFACADCIKIKTFNGFNDLAQMEEYVAQMGVTDGKHLVH